MRSLTRATLLGWPLLCLTSTLSPTKAADEKPVDLQVGDPAPSFEAIDDQGEPVKVATKVSEEKQMPGTKSPNSVAITTRRGKDPSVVPRTGPPLWQGEITMDRPPLLKLIKLGNEWIVTNGELATDGTIRFPENDPAEEVFVGNAAPRVNVPPGQPSAPSESES